MKLCEMFAVRRETLAVRHEGLVDLVRDMREMQKAPSALVRGARRKAAERAVDLYLEACESKGDMNGG
jgi:hypothetical protein